MHVLLTETLWVLWAQAPDGKSIEQSTGATYIEVFNRNMQGMSAAV